jgi:hypothetical protein
MFNDRNKLKERNLLLQIEAAKCRGQLAVGIHEVWNAANERKGKLLIAEKDILFPANATKIENELVTKSFTQTATLQASDVVYETIEKVLEEGGSIEFVENGSLKNYQKMVMIQYR